jgi:hypothetical protein
MDLADATEYFIQHPHNVHSSQQPMELSPKLINWGLHKATLSKYKKIEIIPCILYSNEQIEKEYMKTIPFTIA